MPIAGPEFIDALRIFATEALDLLRDKHASPKYSRPRFAADRWHRDANDPEKLRRIPPSPVWKVVHDYPVWPDWENISELSSYNTICRIVETDDELERRIRIAYMLPYEIVSIGDMDHVAGLDLMLQNDLLDSMIDTQRAFGFSKESFEHSLSSIMTALCDTRITKAAITPLRSTYCSTEIEISSECILRHMTDGEITTGIGFSTLPVRQTPTGMTYLDAIHQLAIAQSSSVEIDVTTNQHSFDEQLRRALRELSGAISNDIVAAINVLCQDGTCTRGESWSSLQTSAAGFLLREGAEYHAPRQPWKTSFSNLDEISSLELSNLVSTFSSKSGRKTLGVATNRLTTAVSRISDEEAIVDLAIAAESLFGSKYPGETTFKTSLNAAIFLRDKETPGSTIRKFFRDVYATRSAIVHGHSRFPSGVDVNDLNEFRTDLTIWIKTAIRKAAQALENDTNALNWDRYLDALLDSNR